MLMLEVPAVASAAAAKIMVCGVPGVSVSVVGVAVTPAGSAEVDTPMVLLNPFAATADTIVCWPKAPVVSVRLVGLTLKEKSGGGAAVTLSTKVAV